MRFLGLRRQGPRGDIEHVVEHAGRHSDHFGKTDFVKVGIDAERLSHELRQVDRPEAAAAVGRQRLFGAVVHIEAIGVEGMDMFDGDVIDLLEAVGRQAIDRRGKALVLQVMAGFGKNLVEPGLLGAVFKTD